MDLIYRLKLLLLLSMGLFASGLHAQENSGHAGIFLRYGIGSQSFGMGRTYAATTADAYAIFTNPAGMINANQAELATLYSNLYYDSQFAQMGFLLPRPLKASKSKLLHYLFGPHSSIGIGWLGLNTTGFEQRTNTGLFLGNFDLQENGFYMAWAHEHIFDWGILSYGLNQKVINQHFPGLQGNAQMSVSAFEKDWTFGMDAGMIFQPVHAPLLNLISLKYIMPLKLGLVCHNLVQPGWQQQNGRINPFPRILRYGFQYTFHMKDWIPGTWSEIYAVLKNTHFNVAYDQEYANDADLGRFFGIEGVIPVYKEFTFTARAGRNNQTEDKNLGFGIVIPFQGNSKIKVDYVYGFHPYLIGDSRIFLSLKYGRQYNAQYFYDEAAREEMALKERQTNLLRALSHYPEPFVMESAEALIASADSSRTERYHDLLGGLGRAQWNFMKARNLLKQEKYKQAAYIAETAADDYTRHFVKDESPLTDKDLMDYAETLLISGYYEDARVVLNEVENRELRTYFLLGVGLQKLEDYDKSIDAFQRAVKQYSEEQNKSSMVCLSFLGIAQGLIEKHQYRTAITALESIVNNYQEALDENYPRYWIFKDGYVVDEAQFMIGYCWLKIKEYERAANALFLLRRFYPLTDYGKWAYSNHSQILNLLDEIDTETFNKFAKTMRNRFREKNEPLFKAH